MKNTELKAKYNIIILARWVDDYIKIVDRRWVRF